MKKRLLSTLLVLSMLLALLPSTAAAERAAVIEIGTAQELRAFAAEVNSGNDHTGVRVLLTADIDLGGKAEPWIPIGSSSANSFNGTFDGNGHVITGLYFNGSLGGLFRYIGNTGIVENLGVYGLVSGSTLLGGIAACNHGFIRNCYNGCFVTGSGTIAGGIAAANFGTIENCYNIGAISSSALVGGIIGRGIGRPQQRRFVQDCYNFGSVSGQDNATAGGIAGSYNAESFEVLNCYYLSGTADKASNYEQDGHVLTPEQFLSQNSFSGWDFSTVWKIDPQLGRPVLQTVLEAIPPTEHTHSYSANWETNTKQHWHTCNGCGLLLDLSDHRYPDNWDSDDTQHWRVCLDCGYRSAANHTRTISGPSVPPTCTTPGSASEIRCSVCDRFLQGATVIEPMGHKYSYDWEHNSDNHWHACTRCNDTKDVSAHIWQETSYVSSTGLRTYICTVCHMTKKEQVPLYPITLLPPAIGGTLSSSHNETAEGINVLLTVVPDADYLLNTLTVTDGEGRELPLTRVSDQEYRFAMPAGPVSVTASFRAFTGPVLVVSVPSAPVQDEAAFAFTPTYKGNPISWDVVDIPSGDLADGLRQYLHTTGTVTFQSILLTAQEPMTCTVTGLSGDGSIYFDFPAGLIQYHGTDSYAVTSGEVCVDNTPPKISLHYYPEPVMTLRVGDKYVEYGASVSDNLDSDIKAKLTIDASRLDTNTPGTYTVFYTAVDHAGNTTTAERTVQVIVCNDHVEDEGRVTKPATETTTGIKTYYCQLCHTPVRTEVIPIHVHDTPWIYDRQCHWRWCSLCQDIVDIESCTFSPLYIAKEPDGTIARAELCLVCGHYTNWWELESRHIRTAEDLRQLAIEVNGGNNHHDTYFILDNDIDLGGSDHPWTPIGNTFTTPFCGVFEGNGHSITGLSINVVANSNQYSLGLFGCVDYHGFVQNLSVSGSVSVTGTTYARSGGIAGYNRGTIQNCYNACSITGTSNAGGIAGENDGRITNCYNTGSIFASMWNGAYAGGIVGNNAHYATVENCYNYGTVQGEAENKGGVVGGNTETDAQVISSYYLSGTLDSAPAARRTASRALSAQSPVSTGEERDEVDFLLEETFVDWDFATVWTMNDSLGRPTLRSVPEGTSPQTPPDPETPDQPDKPSGGGGGGGGGGGSAGGGSPSPSPEPSPSISPSPSPAPTQEPPPATVAAVDLPFADVPAGAWYRPAVAEVYARGIMAGVGPGSFAPDAPASRGMVVTLLYRMENEPSAIGRRFSDVAGEMYYTNAVVWATSSGIVTGYEDGSFRPDSTVTREQLAAMLYRYARRKGYAVSAGADLSGYRDVDQISGYALEAMKWANAQGLLTGTDWGGLAPQTETSRAEIAAILARFLEKVEGHS